jgi:hypothetical protein
MRNRGSWGDSAQRAASTHLPHSDFFHSFSVPRGIGHVEGTAARAVSAGQTMVTAVVRALSRRGWPRTCASRPFCSFRKCVSRAQFRYAPIGLPLILQCSSSLSDRRVDVHRTIQRLLCETDNARFNLLLQVLGAAALIGGMLRINRTRPNRQTRPTSE